MKRNTFDSRKAAQAVARELDKRLDRVAIFIVNGIVASFGSAPPEPKRGGGFKRNSSKAWKRAHPSRPYFPPNIQTGHLKRNIGYDTPSPLVRRIGTGIGNKQSVGYAMALEFGTRRMLPRPFLRPAMAAAKPYIGRFLRGDL